MALKWPAQPQLRSGGLMRYVLLWGAALLLALGMIYYYQGVLIPLRHKQFQISDNPPGNWSDLYPRWLGARELLWHGRNPYSSELTQEIQRGFYGRPIDRSNHGDPKDPQAFAYPVYIAFLLAPFLPFSFDSVRVAFTGLMLLLTVASVPLWMRALRLQLRLWIVLLALVVTMSSYAVVDGLHLEQITLLVAALIAGSVAALVSGWMATAGILLALSTVKPQLSIAVVVFLLLWTWREWRARKRFAFGFGATMAALLIGSELLLPGWFRFWREAAQAYIGYQKPSLLGSLLGQPWSNVAGAVAVWACAMLFWRLGREPAGSDRFNFALIAGLVLTALCLPNAGSAHYNQVMLIPACLWLFTSGWTLARKSRLALLLWVIAVGVFAGEWILALPVSFAGVILHHSFQREATLFVMGPEFLIFVFPVALVYSS